MRTYRETNSYSMLHLLLLKIIMIIIIGNCSCNPYFNSSLNMSLCYSLQGSFFSRWVCKCFFYNTGNKIPSETLIFTLWWSLGQVKIKLLHMADRKDALTQLNSLLCLQMNLYDNITSRFERLQKWLNNSRGRDIEFHPLDDIIRLCE